MGTATELNENKKNSQIILILFVLKACIMQITQGTNKAIDARLR